MPRLIALLVAMLLSFCAAAATAKAPRTAPTKLPRCDVKINQPAASVSLNRAKAPPSVCVMGCDARLVGVRRERGQIAALAIYSGKRCLPARRKPAPKTVIAKAPQAVPGPRTKTQPQR